MTPEERKAAAAVMASDGPWQYRYRNESTWNDYVLKEPDWNWEHREYRVKPKPIVRYVNIGKESWVTGSYLSREDANRGANDGRHACVRVEFTEGQFDE